MCMEDGTIHKFVAPHTVFRQEVMVEFIKVQLLHMRVQGMGMLCFKSRTTTDG